MRTVRLNIKQRLKLALLILLLGSLTIAIHQWYQGKHQISPATLTLLVPDSADLSDPKITLWLEAAREEGIRLDALRDSQFLKPWFDRSQLAGIVLADQFHRVASDILVDTLTDYVAQGGRLMLVYDAGVWTRAERYAEPYSRFTALAGISYGHYAKLRDRVASWSTLLGSASTFDALQVPPGKYNLYEDMREYASTNPVQRELIDEPLYALSGYDQPALSYNVFVTEGDYAGKVLLQTPDGSVAAGINPYGQGEVLFVNLPLGYLKQRTDGVMTHGFLHYFADHILALPRLASVPDGIGGLVMNWHLDSNVTFAALKNLRRLGFYEQGPFSVHITSGPDAQRKGDRGGINVSKSPTMQSWIKTFQQKSYQVGSHGGWIHDYWGQQVPDQPTDEFVAFLEHNKQVLEAVTGKSVIEYSAPEGNHPLWVNDWLQDNGFVAYYSAGNSGMAPTRSFRAGHLAYPALWSFPIVTYRDMAGFEELHESGVSDAEVSDWLHAISDFGVRHHNVRLIYFHPRGALLYPRAMRAWLKQTKYSKELGQFNWYTLSGLSTFLHRRLATQWTVQESDKVQSFHAQNPQDLAGHCWLLPKSRYQRPAIVVGNGKVDEDGVHWLIKAETGNELRFDAKVVDVP